MHPILFNIPLPYHGHYGIHSYAAMLLVAFVLGLGRVYLVAKQQSDPRVTPDNIVDMGIWMFIWGVVGARVLFVLLDWREYAAAPSSVFHIWEGGLSFHGSLLGALLAMIGICLRRRMPFLKVADIFAPTAMLGYAIGRIGCLLNGCCYGALTNLPWGIRFYEDGALMPPRHPTQLYATLISLVWFGVLVWMERRKIYDGQLMCWYILFSAIERFIMEIWRAGVTSDVVALGFTDVQWLCLTMAAIALAGMRILRRYGRRSTRPASASLETATS